jgi:phage-related holin
MQKVRSNNLIKIIFRAAYKTTTSRISLMVLFTIAYMLYLVLEEGSPIFKRTLSILIRNFSIFIHTTNRILFNLFY